MKKKLTLVLAKSEMSEYFKMKYNADLQFIKSSKQVYHLNLYKKQSEKRNAQRKDTDI